jgi:zinc transport system permease protein
VSDFLTTMFDPSISFLKYALIAGLLSSFAFGIVGTYVVSRRISYIAGAISHSVLGGIGIGLYLQVHYNSAWFNPMTGAFASAMVSALIIGYVTRHGNQREDTVIGAIWAIGMAVGLLFIARTPGYIDPMSYLFGNILMITQTDLWLIAGLDAVIVIIAILFYNTLQAISFDEEFAYLRGINVNFFFLLLLCLTAMTIVVLVRIVGIVMVIALLTLPAGTAGIFTKKLSQMMIIAILLCMVYTTIGLSFSYINDFPTGPTIILISGIFYILAVAVSSWRKKGKQF